MGGDLPSASRGEGFSDTIPLAASLAQRLGWTPDIFWAATPADLRLALGPAPAAPALDTATLARLMQENPDAKPER